MSKCSFAVVFAIPCPMLGEAIIAAAPDYSKEAAVIKSIATKVSFNAEGAQHSQQVLSVKIQSEAAVRQYGVLSFAYAQEPADRF